MDIPFSFPVTEEDFLSYQEKLSRRPLNDDEREIISEWVPVINSAYLDGMDDGDRAMMDRFIAKHPDLTHFLEAAKAWMEYAAEQRERDGGPAPGCSSAG